MSTFVATQRAVTKREARRWTQDTELAALQVEVTHALLRAFVQANSKSGTRMDPLTIPRPYKSDDPVRVSGHDVSRC